MSLSKVISYDLSPCKFHSMLRQVKKKTSIKYTRPPPHTHLLFRRPPSSLPQFSSLKTHFCSYKDLQRGQFTGTIVRLVVNLTLQLQRFLKVTSESEFESTKFHMDKHWAGDKLSSPSSFRLLRSCNLHLFFHFGEGRAGADLFLLADLIPHI